MKGCLFFCSGIILKKTGKKNISEMAGIGYQLPITMICFSVCALAMMGTPLTVGFISKWLLGRGHSSGQAGAHCRCCLSAHC
jgi:multicomponent Na+:H+ antiporter subunit D